MTAPPVSLRMQKAAFAAEIVAAAASESHSIFSIKIKVR